MMLFGSIEELLIFYIPFLLSLTAHEWAHAWTANYLGDDTARHLGRMTLDPLAHIDPLGTVVLPLLGAPIGWAKPVPVNPMRFKGVRLRTGMLLVAAAGPACNLAIATVFFVCWFLAELIAPGLISESPIRQVFEITIVLNIALALFNALPIPPLDGGRVVDGLMPREWRPQWLAITAYAPYILGGIITLSFFAGGGAMMSTLSLWARALVP